MCKSLLHGSGVESVKGSQRAAEAWHSERPGKAIGESAASVAVKTPGLKGSWRESEALHPKRQEEAIGEGVASVSVETPAFWRCRDHGTTTKDSGRCGMELAWVCEMS